MVDGGGDCCTLFVNEWRQCETIACESEQSESAAVRMAALTLLQSLMKCRLSVQNNYNNRNTNNNNNNNNNKDEGINNINNVAFKSFKIKPTAFLNILAQYASDDVHPRVRKHAMQLLGALLIDSSQMHAITAHNERNFSARIFILQQSLLLYIFKRVARALHDEFEAVRIQAVKLLWSLSIHYPLIKINENDNAEDEQMEINNNNNNNNSSTSTSLAEDAFSKICSAASADVSEVVRAAACTFARSL